MEKLIIFLIFIGFSAIRGIIKTANEKAEKERLLAQRDANPARRQKVQSEIESFLSEVGGGNAEQRRTEADSQRTAERRERRRQQAEAKKREVALQQAEQKRQQELQKRRQRQRQQSSSTSLSSSPGERRVGSGISDHVDQYINQHVTEYVDNDVAEYVEATIVGSVNQNLGNRNAELPAQSGGTRPRNAAAKAVVSLLRDPVGVRNAILVNEILSRPKSLRKRAD
ncbi:MAG: hypothetical protein R3C59_01515 [Planctomycetaceae bacterium]